MDTGHTPNLRLRTGIRHPACAVRLRSVCRIHNNQFLRPLLQHGAKLPPSRRKDLAVQPRLPRPALDYPERRFPGHRPVSQSVLPTDRMTPEQRPLPISHEFHRLKIRVHILLRQVTRGHHVVPSPLLVEPEKAPHVQYHDPQGYRRGDPREAEHQDTNQRLVAQTSQRRDVDPVQKPPRRGRRVEQHAPELLYASCP